MTALRDPRTLVTGLVLGTLAFLACEWLVVRPRAQANDEARARLEVLKIENERTERMIAEYESFKRDAAEIEQQFAVAVEAVPSEAELASALEDLEGVTTASGMRLVRFSPQPSAPRSASAPPPAAIESQPITIALRGTYVDFQRLLGRLAGYERLLTVEGFRMRSATAGRFTLEATVDLKCYFKRVPDPVGREVARR
jgi:Tfp pilus assembly protein PilO